MMNNNKILTVSYGTFSCTLEGFDDSFDTMKAIAEYFRDLAADDRYFGAEPPQPDAEMLARIAEREVARRVEAREHEGRIMLKAHEEPARPEPSNVATALAAATAAPAQALDETPQTSEYEKAVEETAAEAPSEVTEPEVAAVAQAEDGVAAQVETARTEAPEAGHDVVQDMDGTNPMDSREAPATDGSDAAAFFAQSESDVASETEEEDEGEAFNAAAETETAVTAAQDVENFMPEDVAPTAAPTDTSLADKLERIRAVVSTQHDDPADVAYDEDTEEPTEMHGFDALDGLADMAEDTSEDSVEQAARDISDAFEIDDATQTAADGDASDDGDDLDSLLRRLAGTDDAVAEDAVAEDAVSEDADVDLAADNTEDESAGNLFVESADADNADMDTFEDEGDESELSVSPVASELQDFEDDALAQAARLSDEQEAELQRDLADLENEAEQAAPKPSTARENLPDLGNDNAEDVTRLMAEVDHQMQEPEGKTRRSAFAHLRAAVAARFADRSMDEGDKKVEEAALAYRSDLAEVVKPRRPVASSRPEGHEIARPAPLKLVAEQRIDTVRDSSERGPISPRRVAAPDLEDPEAAEDSGFALYAEEHGAENLPDLLEAAAAYLSFIEGYEQFSRPQLMSRVRQADSGDFSREDGLRAFGQLLRTGKIEKIKGGRFTAADGIGFKPDHRAAG